MGRFAWSSGSPHFPFYSLMHVYDGEGVEGKVYPTWSPRVALWGVVPVTYYITLKV